jgi:hypothetical protein
MFPPAAVRSDSDRDSDGLAVSPKKARSDSNARLGHPRLGHPKPRSDSDDCTPTKSARSLPARTFTPRPQSSRRSSCSMHRSAARCSPPPLITRIRLRCSAGSRNAADQSGLTGSPSHWISLNGSAGLRSLRRRLRVGPFLRLDSDAEHRPCSLSRSPQLSIRVRAAAITSPYLAPHFYSLSLTLLSCRGLGATRSDTPGQTPLPQLRL